jgi:hypothetical protein
MKLLLISLLTILSLGIGACSGGSGSSGTGGGMRGAGGGIHP